MIRARVPCAVDPHLTRVRAVRDVLRHHSEPREGIEPSTYALREHLEGWQRPATTRPDPS
jgi:hypothetical protein